MLDDFKIEFIANFDEWSKKYFKKLKGKDREIQIRWAKIRALRRELLKLLRKQANTKSKKIGVCINDLQIVPEKLFDCSVGAVRKFRNQVKYDDST